jgi:hypothetical protein
LFQIEAKKPRYLVNDEALRECMEKGSGEFQEKNVEEFLTAGEKPMR